MVMPGELYALAAWTVKAGKQDEFIHLWEGFATWTSENQPGAGDGYLLQDQENPQKFISYGPWENPDDMADWRSRPQFRQFFAQARELCDEIQPRTLKMVANLKSRGG